MKQVRMTLGDLIYFRTYPHITSISKDSISVFNNLLDVTIEGGSIELTDCGETRDIRVGPR